MIRWLGRPNCCTSSFRSAGGGSTRPFNSIRHLHASRIALASRAKTIKRIVYPFLKDKSQIQEILHKNKEIPFNVMRDVLGIPLADPRSLDDVSIAWIELITEGNDRFIKSSIDEKGEEKFWGITLKLALIEPDFLGQLVKFLKNGRIDHLKGPTPVAETLIASLLNSEKFDLAYSIFPDLLGKSKSIYWKPIFDVCLIASDSRPLQVLKLIHMEYGQDLYESIIPYLMTMKLKEHYIHRWNSRLISLGDFPRDTSSKLNPVFTSIIDTSNFLNLKQCIRNLGCHIKSPQKWLQKDTVKLFSRFIKHSQDQAASLNLLIAVFGCQSFGKEFWIGLLYNTEISSSTITSFAQKAGMNTEDAYFTQAMSQRILDEDPEIFVDVANQLLETNQSPGILLQVLKSHIRTSQNSLESFECAKRLIQSFPTMASIIAKSFIIETAKKPRSSMDSQLSFCYLEDFLENQKIQNDSILNLLVYGNFKFDQIERAVKNIEKLLSREDSKIDSRTIDITFKTLVNHQKTLPEELLDGQNALYSIMSLVLRMDGHNSDISTGAFNSMLYNIATSSSFKTFEKVDMLALGIADHINSKNLRNFHSASFCHPLREVFTTHVLKALVEKGFNDSERPWCGMELAAKLQAKGVYIEKPLLRRKYQELLDIAFMETSERQRLKSTKRFKIDLPLDQVFDRLNQIEQTMTQF